MDEEQGWLKYHYDRILIESSRIITPTLPGCTLVLNGAQVEMLRNCAHYLDRRSTFVSEYGELTYETPDDDDWDDIRAQVADLEEKLMGDLNVPWGFNDRIVEDLGGIQSGDGNYSKASTIVPVGEVHKIELVTLMNDTGARGYTQFFATGESDYYYLAYSSGLGQRVPLLYTGGFTLKAGDRITVVMKTCLNNDVLIGGIWGYKMLV